MEIDYKMEKENRLGSRKGFFFTFDAFFALALILFALIISAKFFIEEQVSPPIDYMSKDVINSLANIKINEVNNSWVRYLISNGTIVRTNNSVIEQIGEFYVHLIFFTHI